LSKLAFIHIYSAEGYTNMTFCILCGINSKHSDIFNQRLPGACNHSPGSKLLSITTQLHCGGHLGGRVQLPDTILEEDHPMTIPSKFGFN
jgi:hypothetical protein